MAAKSQDLQANERLVREMSEAIWGPEGSADAIDDYYSEDVVDHEPGETLEGREAVKQLEAGLRQGFPDLEGEVELVVCQDDLVATRYTATGTHTGEFWGIEPTGERGTVTGMAIYRIEDGKVVESWNEFDRHGMFQQLGLVPEEPAA